MSMLRYFFEKNPEKDSRIFQGLDIMKAGVKYLDHMGKYPVIMISLKSMKQPSYELAFEMLKKALKGEFQRHWKMVSDSGRLTDADQRRYPLV